MISKMLYGQNSSRMAVGSDGPRAAVSRLFQRVAEDREVVISISNALISVSDSNRGPFVKAKAVIEELRALVKRGVDSILEALSQVDGDLCRVLQFSEMVDLPIQELLVAGGKLYGSLENAEERENGSREATDTLEGVLTDQRALREHLLRKIDLIIASSDETLVILERLIDQLQGSFAEMSVLAARR